jgi:hypothetical protein
MPTHRLAELVCVRIHPDALDLRFFDGTDLRGHSIAILELGLLTSERAEGARSTHAVRFQAHTQGAGDAPTPDCTSRGFHEKKTRTR